MFMTKLKYNLVFRNCYNHPAEKNYLAVCTAMYVTHRTSNNMLHIGTSVVVLAQFYLQSMLSGQELASCCLGRNAGCYWTYKEEK